MRDALLWVIFMGGGVYALYRPWVGALMWTNISLMSPHVEFTWSGADKPFGMLIAVCTLVGAVITREKHSPWVASPMLWLTLFVVWTCVTLPFSFYLSESLPLFERSIKIFLMLFVTVALIDSRKKLEFFLWVCAISIGYYGFKGGIFTILTGGQFRVWGPGGFVGGNNEIAVALIMTIPLIRYLQLQQTNKWIRRGMTGWMLLCAVAAIGSYSRGAFLAIGVMSIFFWAKGQNKMMWGALILLGVLMFLPMMPDRFWERMQTIGTYQADDSALGRINAWWNAFNLANDRLFGGGFMIYKPDIFALYSPDPTRIHAAHSIYFQVLGEHGWIGLMLYMAITISAWRRSSELVRLAAQHPEHDLQWAADLAKMLQVSLIGFGAGGAFLSLAYFDLPYNVVVAIALAHWLVTRQLAQGLQPASPTDMRSKVPWPGVSTQPTGRFSR